jgi:hypothetical protein
MIIQKWLVINSRGGTKLATKEPRLGVNEIAFQLKLDIPYTIFRRPMINAELKIPQDIVLPDQLTAEVTDNIEEAIKSVTGLEMRVSIVEPEEE